MSSLKTIPEIKSMGVSIFDPFWKNNDHVDPHIEMLHVLDGSFNLVLGDKHFKGTKGDTFLIPSGVTHRDDFDLNTDFKVFMMHFQWDGEVEFWRIYGETVACARTDVFKIKILDIIKRMRQDFSSHSELDRTLAGAYCLAILSLMMKSISEDDTEIGRNERQHSLMVRAKHFVDEHYNEVIALGDIADALHVSSFHLSHVFSQENDFSLFSYLTKVRMDHARNLLLDGNYNVTEVAEAVGYTDPNYFSRVFKRFFQQSPSEILKH